MGDQFCECRGGALKCTCGFCGMRAGCCHPIPKEPEASHQPTVEKPTIEGFKKQYGTHGVKVLFQTYKDEVERSNADVQFRDNLGREIEKVINELTAALESIQ